MNIEPKSDHYGIAASVGELVSVRPPPASSGFAPGGRVKTHQYGTNRSIYRGRGMEFDESRIYQPGDDIRNIDWRVTARTGSVHTKLFHEERERPVYLLLDCRRMMRFGTRECFKSVLAARIAAQLAWVAVDGGDRVGGLVMSPTGFELFDAKRSRAQLLMLLKGMSDATFMDASVAPAELSLTDGMARLRRVCRPGSLVFLISDFADVDADMKREYQRLASRTQMTSVFIYDVLEQQMPERGFYQFTDGNQVSGLNSGDRTAQQQYEHNFNERYTAIESLSVRNGMAFIPMATGQHHRDVLQPHKSTKPVSVISGVAA